MPRQRRRRRERLPARIAAPNLAGSATTPSAAPYLCCCAYRLLPASIFLAIESLPTTGRPPGAVSTHPAASTHVAQHKRVPSCACLALQPPLTCMSLLRVPLPPPLPLPSQAAPLLCGHPAARSHPVKLAPATKCARMAVHTPFLYAQPHLPHSRSECAAAVRGTPGTACAFAACAPHCGWRQFGVERRGDT